MSCTAYTHYIVNAYLFSGLVEVEAGSDKFMSLLCPSNKSLPSGGDSVSDLLHRLWVVVLVGEESLGSLADVHGRSMRFLQIGISKGKSR